MSRTLWLVLGLVLYAPSLRAQSPAIFPAPTTLGPVESYGRHIQRTMTLLATSTPQHRNTVKVLFYGQSITEQTWSKLVADDLRRRFPAANLIIENRAIGGHSSPRLLKTMEADVLPFYPDLVIFHVYGDDGDYERIIRRIRTETTAELLIQTDHLRRTDDPTKEETDPAKIVRSKETWDSWMNYVFLPRVAREYGAELVNQRELWKRYLLDHKLEPGALLKDDVHLNEHGNYLMAEIVKAFLRYDPKFPQDEWKEAVKTYEVGKDVKWKDSKLAFDFDGNRVDVIFKGGTSQLVVVRIDGKDPASFPELYAFTRVSHYPQPSRPQSAKWPMMLRVQRGATQLQVEDWTLTLTELSPDYKQVRFTLAGSKTGEDGAGVSTERFVSKSGRIVIEPGDWNLEYCFQVLKDPLSPGAKIEWKVVPLAVRNILVIEGEKSKAVPGIEIAVTAARGLSNGPHQLELRGQKHSPVTALRVYRPAIKQEEKGK